MTDEDVLEIRTTLRQWKKMCYAMLAQAQKNQEGKLTVKNVKSMCKVVRSCILHSPTLKTDSIVLSIDTMTSKIQGIAIVSTTKNFVVLRDIVTNPENIRRSINTTTAEKLHGVGTSIIAQIARTCLSEGKEGIFLSSLEEAEGFYSKCGFEKLSPDEDCLKSMFLSAKKLQTPEVALSLLRTGASLTPTDSTERISLSTNPYRS